MEQVTGALDAPFDHVNPRYEGAFAWQRLFSQREDLPAVLGQGKAVCVVGAGIAGLVTAYELARRQFRVTLLEATERCGGRIQTHYFRDGTYGELGAMRIPLMHSAVLDYIEEFDLPTRPFVNNNPAARFYFDGVSSTVAGGDIIGDVNSAKAGGRYELLRRAFPDLRQVTEERYGLGPRALLFDLLIGPLLSRLSGNNDMWDLFRSRSYGATVEYLSRTTLTEFAMDEQIGLSHDDWQFLSRATGIAPLRDCSVLQFIMDMVPTLTSPSMVEIVGGMELLTRAFLHRLGASRVLMQSRLAQVRLLDSGVGLEWRDLSDNPVRESFDFVVVTVPPPDLMRIQFDCPYAIDDKQRAISTTAMGPLAKTLLHFSERFWELQDPGIFGGLSFTGLPSLQCWYPSDNAHKSRSLSGKAMFRARNPEWSNRPGVLTGSYRWGDGAREFGKLSDEDRLNSTLSDLATVHALDEAFIKTRLIDSHHKYWESGYTILNLQNQRALSMPLSDIHGQQRVFFAGEHIGLGHGWIVSAVVPALACVKEVLDASLQSSTTAAGSP